LQWQQDNHTIESYLYPNCPNKTHIEYILVQSGEHEWFTEEYHKFDTTKYSIEWLDKVADQQYGIRKNIFNHKKQYAYSTIYKDTLYKARLSYTNPVAILPKEKELLNPIIINNEDNKHTRRQAILPLNYEKNSVKDDTMTNTVRKKKKGSKKSSKSKNYTPPNNQNENKYTDNNNNPELANDMENLNNLFSELRQTADKSSKQYNLDHVEEIDLDADGSYNDHEEN